MNNYQEPILMGITDQDQSIFFFRMKRIVKNLTPHYARSSLRHHRAFTLWVGKGLRFGPTINPIFTNQQSEYYWTSTTSVYDQRFAWGVSFYFGNVYHVDYDNNYVRCVKGGDSEISSYTDNRNGTVTDAKIGLVWQQGEPAYMTWPDALNYCENLELPAGSGIRDWRLPNIKELDSITDDAIYDPVNPIAINRNFFPNAAASIYWSSTTDVLSQ